jgi:hypothetical protein
LAGPEAANAVGPPAVAAVFLTQPECHLAGLR